MPKPKRGILGHFLRENPGGRIRGVQPGMGHHVERMLEREPREGFAVAQHEETQRKFRNLPGEGHVEQERHGLFGFLGGLLGKLLFPLRLIDMLLGKSRPRGWDPKATEEYIRRERTKLARERGMEVPQEQHQ